MSTLKISLISILVAFIIYTWLKPPKRPRQLTGEEMMERWAGKPQHPYRIVPPEEILQHPVVAGLVEEIYVGFRETEEVFNRDFKPIIQSVIRYAQLLPASERHHHAYRLGLLIHSLDVCSLMMRHLCEMSPYTPHPGPPDAYERLDYYRHARICIGLIGICHDLAKVGTDIEVRFLDRKTLNTSDLPAYDPHGKGGLYSESLYDYAIRCFKEEVVARYEPYRVIFKRGRQMNAHDRDTFQVMNAILTHSGIAIPNHIRSAYLYPNSEFFRRTLLPLRQEADRESVERDLEINPVERDDVRIACSMLLECLATQGHLRDLRVIENCRFLTLGALELALHDLPDFEEFACLPTKPHEAERLLHELKANGLHRATNGQRNSPYAFDSYDGEYGLLLSPQTTAAILYWETYNEAEKQPTTCGAGARASDRSAKDRGDDPQFGDASETGAEGAEPPAQLTAGCLRTIPEARAKDAELQQASSAAHSATGTSDVLREFATTLEKMPEADLADPARFSLEASHLVVAKSECAAILDALGLIEPSDHRRFIRESDSRYSARWTAVGTDLVEKVICSPDYSQALIDKTSTSRLLVSQRSGSAN
ncbi:MAG: TraI domain-containing protein [Gammaproteobacteria bacterium]|nr:TraI domain-containing protein [Gammaproteobacteria bacterium]